MAKITKNIKIQELVQKYPETAETLMELGMHCLGCVAARFETLEEGLKAHGMSEEEVEKAVEKLNQVVEATSKSK